MIHAFFKFGDGSVETTCDAASLHRAKDDPNARLWVDLDQPTDDELKLLTDVFQFHPLAVEDTVGYRQRPKIEPYESTNIEAHRSGYYFLVVHGPDLEVKDKLATKELDMFLSERYLVTIHEKRMKAVEDTVAKVEKDPGRLLGDGIDMLLYTVLDLMMDAYFPILDKLQERIDDVEEEATNRPRQQVLQDIGEMKRELLNFRRTIGPQRDVLAQLTRGEVPCVRESTRVYLRDVQDHLNRVVETIEIYRDLVLGARDIYLSSLSNYLNQIMKTLTIITVITLPFTVVTGFFGMNFEAIPGIHSKTGFWAACAVILATVLVLLGWFRRQKWI